MLQPWHEHPHFNSIKVQLEPSWFVASARRTEFQFHKGTIRTTAIMNQFTVMEIFQFHKGTIRTAKACQIMRIFFNFNSIKVQLEHLVGAFLISWVQPFQFHKGTIRTFYGSWNSQRGKEISIP